MSILNGLLFVAFGVSFCYAGELIILQKPQYIELGKAEGSLKLSELQHVISGWFGFTTHKEVEYHGALSSSPFSHPQAVAILSLYNGKQFLEKLDGEKITTTDDEVYVPTHNLEHHLSEFYQSNSNSYKLELDTKVGDLDGRLEGLNDDDEFMKKILADRFQIPNTDSGDLEIQHFLRQLSLTVQALEKVSDYNSGLADVFSFELAMPSDVEDEIRAQMEKAVQSLIKQMEKRMKEEYGEDYILLAVSWDEKHSVSSRKSRSLMQAEGEAETETPKGGRTKESMNVANEYSDDFAPIFHIILWLMVFMALIIIYVTYGMMSMDPGSDSIIYRMTTTRLKKE